MLNLCYGAVFIILVAIGNVAADGGNYPNFKFTPKPCVRVKNTVNFQGLLCAPSNQSGFTKESEENCVKHLKDTCPEFNEAECITGFELAFPNADSPKKALPSVCRLKYKTGGSTWIEIYYTNYVDPSNPSDKPSFDIVEIHRKILKPAEFGERSQEDWPKSVIDPKGERGLKWIKLNLKTPLPKDVTNVMPIDSQLCDVEEEGSRVISSDIQHCEFFADYLKKEYPEGIDPALKPKLTTAEAAGNVTVTINYSSRCIYILTPNSNNTKVPYKFIRRNACQVLYVRQSRCKTSQSDTWFNDAQVSRIHNASFEFLEVQLYRDREAGTFPVQYAYWSEEDVETRDQIFSTDGRV